jgi:aminocarboxymuconate-semialdehyde decarboxylase
MFFTCSPMCSDPTHQHSNEHAFATESQDHLADITIAGLQKKSKGKAEKSGKKTHLVSAKSKQKPKESGRIISRNSKGKLKVVDIHCHYLNPEVAKKTESLGAANYDTSIIFANDLTRQTNVKQMADRASKLTGVDERIRDMDKMGIDIQAVCPAPFQYFYFTEPDLGASIARDVNEGIAKIVADHPDRFVGLGSVPLQNAELAVQELEYAVKKLGLRGVEINTNVNGMDLTDPRLKLDKFFAKANELGIVIFMHPLGTTQADRLVNHYFNNIIGNPMDTTLAVSHLIFDGVIAKNPKIKFVAAHGGGYLAHYWARMDHAWRARPDCRTVIKSKPSSYLKKIYFDTITFDPTMLRHLIDVYGADHVLLGTDYPYDMGEVDPLGLINSVKKLSKEDRQKIQGLNAMKILKIKV